ncbi:sensory box histidine kinase [Desulforapulum autotrophicum HRM2]|uniref:histidine kinase n=1 Tax=Desulforapulum autotrophicum (strain ATCC 43914 / DSM 3382 / VKM B-1955 / HRM2) TaxID=177437 RepID=C0QB32_DESAH|nr:PAS domain S-box protein [Desulforapulum autotrophicum]ACN14831.1 sensory box histidine kinase [Desulforapulum autotrophicum HRM2]
MAGKLTYEELEKRILELEKEKVDRIKAEQALRESENSFVQLFESAPVPMGYAKFVEGYTGTTWNSAWYNTFGYSRKQADGRSGNDIGLWVEPEDRARLITMANRQNYVADFETLLRRHDGDVRNCTLFGRFIETPGNRLLMVVYLDITERKRVEKELHHLRNYLSNIIDSMPSVLIGVDAHGKVTQWNKKAEQATGISSDAAQSQMLSVVFPQLISQMGIITESIKTREIKQELKRPRHLEGNTRFEDVTIYPLIANGVEGAVIRVDDVTEKLSMEKMIVQSEKMLSLGGLAAGMAHEINNPLAGMIQTANVMANRLGGRIDIPANVKAAKASGTTVEAIQKFMEARGIMAMIDTINASGKRAAEIVNNMLSFARKSDAYVSSYHLADLLDKTLELAGSDYDLKKHYDFKTIEIIKKYEADLPMVPCEGNMIQQVLLNVLRNGAQAMQERRGTPNQGCPRFIFRLMREIKTNMLRIEIEDNGPGMDEATSKRIFEPFFTTKPVGVGTGLGLSVSYFIITESHGGKMSVESNPGSGTKFIIQLPF